MGEGSLSQDEIDALLGIGPSLPTEPKKKTSSKDQSKSTTEVLAEDPFADMFIAGNKADPSSDAESNPQTLTPQEMLLFLGSHIPSTINSENKAEIISKVEKYIEKFGSPFQVDLFLYEDISLRENSEQLKKLLTKLSTAGKTALLSDSENAKHKIESNNKVFDPKTYQLVIFYLIIQEEIFKRAAEKEKKHQDEIHSKIKLPLSVVFSDGTISLSEFSSYPSPNAKPLSKFISKKGNLVLGNKILSTVELTKNGLVLTSEVPGKDKVLDAIVEIVCELGRVRVSLESVLNLESGKILKLDKLVGETLDIFLEGHLFASGEAVTIDDMYGIRVTDVHLESSFFQETPLAKTIDSSEEPFLAGRVIYAKTKKHLSDFIFIEEGSIINFETEILTPLRLELPGNLHFPCEFVVVDESLAVRILDQNQKSVFLKEELEISQKETSNKILTKATTSTASTVRPFEFIRRTDPAHLLNFIQGEHPQTIALILSYLDPNKAATIISALPHNMQADVMKRICCMDRVTPEVLMDVESVLERKVSTLASEDYTSAGGIDSVVEILNNVDRGTEKTIIEALTEDDPELAFEIQKRMFVFEDIVLLDDTAIDKLISIVNQIDIAKALKSVDKEVQEKIFKNLSIDELTALKTEMEKLGPVRLKDVEDAQQSIVNILRKLEEEGEIIVARSGEDMMIV